MKKNSKQNDVAQADKVDNTLSNRVSCDQFLLTLNWKLSSMSDFNESFTVFEPLVDLIAYVIYKTCDKNFVALFYASQCWYRVCLYSLLPFNAMCPTKRIRENFSPSLHIIENVHHQWKNWWKLSLSRCCYCRITTGSHYYYMQLQCAVTAQQRDRKRGV